MVLARPQNSSSAIPRVKEGEPQPSLASSTTTGNAQVLFLSLLSALCSLLCSSALLCIIVGLSSLYNNTWWQYQRMVIRVYFSDGSFKRFLCLTSLPSLSSLSSSTPYLPSFPVPSSSLCVPQHYDHQLDHCK